MQKGNKKFFIGVNYSNVLLSQNQVDTPFTANGINLQRYP